MKGESMSEKLLPCPFCGENPQITSEKRLLSLEWNKNYPNDGKDLYINKIMYSVECTCCKLTKLFHTEDEAKESWNSRPVAKKTKVENLKHLLDLVSLNPDLPVLPIVDADCVVSDDYGYWLASIGSVEVTKILDDINYCKDGKFYREDDFDEIVEDLVSESDDPLDEEEAEDIVKNYPWRKVILVYIIPG